MMVRRKHVKEIVKANVPDPHEDEDKGELLRAFIPHEDRSQTVHIPAAVIGDIQLDSKLWHRLWDESCGPCWIKEMDAALAGLEKWRSGIASKKPPDMNTSLCLWPCMPLYALCADDALFLAFKEGIVAYMCKWMSKEYWHDCLGQSNLRSPFALNRNTDERYLGSGKSELYNKSIRTQPPRHRTSFTPSYRPKVPITGGWGGTPVFL
ncbi:hypothetical protein LXA43DRAFT_1096529 [Ganoderma leucocontextum]|nr:hypothetical protein LXA43DRAFT_1096529 [Ganoderma leucocontextum]